MVVGKRNLLRSRFLDVGMSVKLPISVEDVTLRNVTVLLFRREEMTSMKAFLPTPLFLVSPRPMILTEFSIAGACLTVSWYNLYRPLYEIELELLESSFASKGQRDKSWLGCTPLSFVVSRQ